MPPSKAGPKTLVEAVQAVFDALEPFDDGARQRILQSAGSLLGTSIPSPNALQSPSGSSGGPTASGRHGSDRPLSPVELIQQKQPATNAQKIAVFAYHREKVEGLSRFSKDDLRTYFAKAKELPPKNFDRDFRQAVTLGWIYEDGSDSYLTSKGLEAVETGFGGKGLPRGGASRKAKKSTKRKKASKR